MTNTTGYPTPKLTKAQRATVTWFFGTKDWAIVETAEYPRIVANGATAVAFIGATGIVNLPNGMTITRTGAVR